MRINYDFNDLEAFLAVMETQSFHVAAARLNLSQSAVTRRIAKLEEALDNRLFERTTRVVQPTLAAKRLHPRAEAILASADETNRAMRDETVAFANQRNALITIAAIPTALTTFLVPALRRMGGMSNVRIRILDHSAHDVSAAVANGDADFGLTSVALSEPGLRFEMLYEDEIVAAIPKTNPLAEKSQVDWPEIVDSPLILPSRDTGNRLLIDDAMARQKLTPVWMAEVGRTTSALELVAAGLGVALVPNSTAHSPYQNEIQLIPFSSFQIKRPIGILEKTGAKTTPLAETLKQNLRGTALP